MSEADRLWLENNERYLSAALNWLRLKLRRQAEAIEHPRPQGRRSLFDILSGGSPAPRRSAGDGDLDEAKRAMDAAFTADPPPAMALLERRFKAAGYDFSPFEREVLLLAAAMELDTRTGALCASAQGEAHKPYPTFALAMVLFDEPLWNALSPERPLRYWRLIEITQPAGQPLTASALRADERIVSYLKGLACLDDRLAPWLESLRGAGVSLAPSQQAVAEEVLKELRQAHEAQLPAPVVQLLGPDHSAKPQLAAQVCARLNLEPYAVTLSSLPVGAAEIDLFVRLWQRECLLMPVALYVDANDADTPAAAMAAERLFQRSAGLYFANVRDYRPDMGPHTIGKEVPRPPAGEQRDAWIAALGPCAEEAAGMLSGQFRLNVPEIREISSRVTADRESTVPMADRLWQACVERARPRMESLAQRIETSFTLDDVVLPETQKQTLAQIKAQVASRTRVYDEWGFRSRLNRGLGISALFAGQSGTGKTMAAEALAKELKLNLYRIDLSAVVNKYIGETEKNLRRLFDAAEDGGAVLLFDEADALFGKRSEVKDSHDRYANIEINYLLQRLETYSGLVILATNMRSALDKAFTRRLRFIVEFPYPGVKEREQIWRKAFPKREPPLAPALDYARLAAFDLSGAGIQSAALTAAFLAADEKASSVTMAHLLRAVSAEFRKLERPVNEADFTIPIVRGTSA